MRSHKVTEGGGTLDNANSRTCISLLICSIVAQYNSTITLHAVDSFFNHLLNGNTCSCTAAGLACAPLDAWRCMACMDMSPAHGRMDAVSCTDRIQLQYLGTPNMNVWRATAMDATTYNFRIP